METRTDNAAAVRDRMTVDQSLFVNRELSWLGFNRRVLEEAEDETNPVLERIKFLAIASTNLDEFFEVRVAGTKERADAGLPSEGPGSMGAREELELVRKEAALFTAAMHRCWREKLLPALANSGIQVLTSLKNLEPATQNTLREHFRKEVYPVLTPLAVDPAHPFPALLNKSLNLAVLLQDPIRAQARKIAVVQVPRVLPRFVRVADPKGHVFVNMSDLVREHLDALFPGFQVLHACPFRVTRDANIDVDEAEGENLLVSIELGLRKRRRGEPVRLEIGTDAHPEVLERFLEAFGLDPEDVYYCEGPVNLGRLMEIYRTLDLPALKDPLFVPRKATIWQVADAMFADIREGDILLHHPYDSFSTVEDFVRLAASDPKVLAIKQTIYRTSEDSTLVADLIRAAENRKQVTVVVELKARFDEEANIRQARRMEQAGIHVVYGIVGLKTHAKLVLVVRRDDDGLRHYCHLGTGNYNSNTARVYTDLGLLTAREALCKDTADLFNMITGYAQAPVMRHLVAAPFSFRSKLLGWIARETQNAQAGKPARIQAKMNGLSDPEVILALYKASQAGVKIELVVRSICCLKPGVPGLSENIRVVSIVDRFLEHSRIYCFENGGQPEVYLASADWMQRNLDYRVEAIFGVEDAALKKRITEEILATHLRDNVKAREILPDGGFRRIEVTDPAAPRLRSQLHFVALSAAKPAREQQPPQKGARRRRQNKAAG